MKGVVTLNLNVGQTSPLDKIHKAWSKFPMDDVWMMYDLQSHNTD